MNPSTMSPLPVSAISVNALLMPYSCDAKSMPFSNLAELSERSVNARDVFLTLSRANLADSKMIVFVSSLTPLFSPPITPATATGRSASAITSIFSVSMFFFPSRVTISSPLFAFLTTIVAPLRSLRSNACIGCPISVKT